MASTQPQTGVDRVVLQAHEDLAAVEDLQQQDLALAQLRSQCEAQQKRSATGTREEEQDEPLQQSATPQARRHEAGWHAALQQMCQSLPIHRHQLSSQYWVQQQQSAIAARRVEVVVQMASSQPRAGVVLQTNEGLAAGEDLQ